MWCLDRLVVLLACLDATRAAQPTAPQPIAAPLRELPWGQLNFLHTTDTHGWHGGHLQEPQYSADWGDYISFAKHLRDRADTDGSDLLLIDTGDRVEGNGLYDASNPKGRYTFDIIKHQQLDVVTVGNHELYKRNSSNNEYHKTVPDFRHAYIASNLDIYNPESGKLEALAPRYRKFTTKNQGIRILAFGFVFDFHGNANNTVVQNVEDTIKQQWFQDAIRDRNVDLFLVAGHVPVRNSDEMKAIYRAIRGVQWDVPIQFFGGHTHIRDYVKYDKKAYAIESGRYMETIGFQSISGLRSKNAVAEASPTFQRRYIDNNLYSLHHHTGLNSTTFPTELGRNVSKAISHARKELNLDKTYGCAPRDLWLNRAPFPANDSLLTWLASEVLPDIGKRRAGSNARPQVVLTNTGAMRFDIFAGPFTIDTTYLVSPFTSGLRSIRDVPYTAAEQLLDLLNNQGPITLEQMLAVSAEEIGCSTATHERDMLWRLSPPAPPARHTSYHEPSEISPADDSPQIRLGEKREKLIPGYTTVDDAGKEGDDTVHQPIRFYDVPNCIAATVNVDIEHSPDTVDLVYNEFIQSWVFLGLQYLGLKYSVEDSCPSADGKAFTDIISEWVGKNWPCDR